MVGGILARPWLNYFFSKGDNPIFKLNLQSMGNLLYIIAVILIIGWLLGMFAFHVTGGLIHALLVVAVILFLIQLLGGRRGV
jgi:hypothetical protein